MSGDAENNHNIAHDPAFLALTQKIDSVALTTSIMHQDFSEMKGVLRELTAAILKLAIVEERQTELSKALERSFTSITAVDTRLRALEMKGPEMSRTTMWVERATVAVVAVVFLFVVGKAGLL